MPFLTHAFIDGDAFSSKILRVKQFTPEKLTMAVIEDNAYGHGYKYLIKNLNAVEVISGIRIVEAITLREKECQ